MPRMDGFAFTRELRKHKLGGDVPLIVTSAIYKDQATISRLQAETGAQFFSKPFQIKELLDAVKRLLGDPAVAAQQIGAPRRHADRRAQAHRRAADGRLARRAPPAARAARAVGEAHHRHAHASSAARSKRRSRSSTARRSPPRSNLRTETLGHFLVARGIIDEARHQQALKRAQESQERLGQALVELGFITDAELHEAARRADALQDHQRPALEGRRLAC